jgi:uncharacterized repeat protein (TIGR03803 family)
MNANTSRHKNVITFTGVGYAVLLCLFCCRAALAQVTFFQPPAYSGQGVVLAAASPAPVSPGDVNGDGKIHLSAPEHRTTSRKDLSHLKADQQSPNGPEQVLYAFHGSPDGQGPGGGLIFDSKGNLYGTTEDGGTGPCTAGCGTVFELSPNGSGGWTETILYNFQGGNDGASPYAGLIFDKAGNLYGTTATGGGGTGSPCDSIGCGTVFELGPKAGGGWTETVLYSFQGGSADGFNPQAIVFDASGNLFGTTGGPGQLGGGCIGTNCGTVFELSPKAGGGWTEAIAYTFSCCSTNGWNPNSGLAFDSSGNLYGVTFWGGGTSCGGDPPAGCGTVFELSPNGTGGWTETILHSFAGGNETDGESPNGALILDQAGNLYGTTARGGTGSCGPVMGNMGGCGTVFEVSPNGRGGWTESVLYSFQGGSVLGGSIDGGDPLAGLIFDHSGNVYGTTGSGGSCSAGTQGCGTVFELSPNGKGGWVETILYRFQGTSDGDEPDSSLILDSIGNAYGTAYPGVGANACNGVPSCGVVFEVSTTPGFQVSASSTSQTISAGQSAKFSLMIGPLGLFGGTVNLSCSIKPVVSPAPSCGLSSSSVQITSGGSQTVTVTVGTTAPGTAGTVSQLNFPSGWVPLAWTGMLVGLGYLWLRNRNRLPALAPPIIVLAVALWVGCGGSSSSSQTTSGTPAGTYTATVTASSGSLTHNMVLTVVVQ